MLLHYTSVSMSIRTPSSSPLPNPVATASSASSAPSPMTSRLWKKLSIASAKLIPAPFWKSPTKPAPAGFGIARRLKQLKVSCLVAAPSLIPKQPGAPFKTDKRDARGLARLLRAGELTGVYIPESTDEAIRDLCRARTDAVDDHRRCRHRLKGFLLRHGFRYQ